MKKAIQIILIVVVVGLFAAGMFLGDAIKKSVEVLGSQITGVAVTVDDVEFNAFTGSVAISGLKVANPEGFKSDYAFSLGHVFVDIDIMSLFSDVITIEMIAINKPSISYEIGFQGTNIGAIEKNITSGGGESSAQTSDSSSGSAAGKKVVIANLYVREANLIAGLGDNGASLGLPEIHLQDIGKENGGGGASFTNAAKQVLAAVVKSIASADISEITNVLGGGGKDVGEKIKNVTDKLKGLF